MSQQQPQWLAQVQRLDDVEPIKGEAEAVTDKEKVAEALKVVSDKLEQESQQR